MIGPRVFAHFLVDRTDLTNKDARKVGGGERTFESLCSPRQSRTGLRRIEVMTYVEPSNSPNIFHHRLGTGGLLGRGGYRVLRQVRVLDPV